MTEPTRSKVGIIGAVVSVVGINLSFGVIVFALAGGAGPLSLMQGLFLGE